MTDWLQRTAARTVAVRRFETPPGKQAEVGWGRLGTIEMQGEKRNLWGFAFTLGHSRMMMAEAPLRLEPSLRFEPSRVGLPIRARLHILLLTVLGVSVTFL